MKHYIHPDYDYVNIVELSKDEIKEFDFAACEEPRETLGSFYNRQVIKPDVLVNAGFFTLTTGTPVLNNIDECIVRASNSSFRTGMGLKNGEKNNLLFGSLDDGTDWIDFLSAYPVLLEGNGIIDTFSYATEINYNAVRSCLAFNNDNVFVIHIGSPGMNFKTMSTMLFYMGADYAINLDGGGSARLMYNGEVVGTPTENRSVDNVLAIYLKTEDESSSNNTVVSDAKYISYTVVKGDSWWSIAASQLGSGTMYKDLMSFNNITSTILSVGQVIKIPVSSYEYTVVSGDTWWGISARELGSGTRMTELAEFNDKSTTDTIYPGEILYIPV